MDLPHSISQLRQIACGLTVIPFPDNQTTLLGKKSTLWKTVKKPCWLAQCSCHWFNSSKKITLRRTKREKIFKTCTQYKPESPKSFARVKMEVEIEMLELFSFLKEVNIPAKMNLLEKFNQKISSKEIRTTEQMRAFLHKTEKLAECIKLHLRKNEYSENFTKDISFDVFEQGFNKPKSQEKKKVTV